MEFIRLKDAAEKITMTEETRQRIMNNCKMQIANMEDQTMNKSVNKSWFKKPAAVFAALAICLSLSVTAMAATGVLQGFFSDVTDWRGAVVGTSYEQADDEIDLQVVVEGNEFTALASIVDAEKFPYRDLDTLRITDYQILDAADNVMVKGTDSEIAQIIDGYAAIKIDFDELEKGDYKLTVKTFVGEKKADKPLDINGEWECAFTVE